MLSAYTPPTSLTIQPGHTVKKAETTPETLKRVSAFIHFNRQKKYRGKYFESFYIREKTITISSHLFVINFCKDNCRALLAPHF